MAKQEMNLDEYEVRNARGWDRHMILALLSVVRAACLLPPAPPQKRPRADRAGNPAAVAASAAARGRGHEAGAGLVGLAPAPPVGGPGLSLPPAAGHHPVNFHCSVLRAKVSSRRLWRP